MRIDIVTLFPELCDGFLSASILGRARAKNLFEAHCHQIRDYTKNKQRQTDDYPYGWPPTIRWRWSAAITRASTSASLMPSATRRFLSATTC